MPPKKTRAAANQAVSASQPLPETSRPTRTSGRKRRHSDGSNASDVSSVVETTEVKSKKQKRGRGRPAKRQPEEEVIVEEDEVIEEPEHAAPSWPAQSEEQAMLDSEAGAELEEDDDEIEVSQSNGKHVHFGGDLQLDDDYATATNITPHPRKKMSIKRKTLSPNAGSESKRFKTASSRTSLPPNLSQEEYDPAKIIQELRFAPLNEILQERVRQLMAKKNAQRNSNVNGEDVDMEESGDMLVLDSQEEVNYPRLPATPKTPLIRISKIDASGEEETLEAVTPGRRLRVDWERERRAFQDAILALNEIADKAKGDLQILNIELSALGFEGEDSRIIVRSIREAFARTREDLEEQLPATIPEDASNEDILEILTANVKEFANRLRVADGELNEKSTLINNLGGQVDNLINRLAEKEVRHSTLQQQWQSMDRGNEEKAAQIVDLEEELQAMTDDRDAKEDERDEERQRADDLAKEKSDFEASIARLSESLQQYRNEEDRLTQTVNRMEEEHRNTVAAMNKERQETVEDLEDRLDKEMTARDGAEQQAGDRQAAIDELEAKVQDIETKRDSLHEQLETVSKERDDEIEANNEAQEDLKARESEVQDLEGRVSRLETELDDLNGELETLRKHNETERRQREAAETDLDDRDQTIDQINRQLHDQGKQANELRQKLFEVQQKNAEKVKQLEEEASERDEQHQADLIKETDQREAAEDLAEERAGTIQELETRLQEIEQQMRDLLSEKDTRIAELEDELTQKDNEMQDLRNDLQAAQNTYESEAQEHNERAQELEGSIAALQETIASHEQNIRALEREAANAAQDHNAQTEERDAAIAQLNARVAELESEKEHLEGEKLNLEGRVTREAEAMLEMQNEKQDEIDSLRAIIEEKQAKIVVVQEKAKAADDSWNEVLTAREEEIAELKTAAQTSETSVEALTSTNEEIQRRFREYVRRSSGVIGALQERVRELNAQAEQDGDDLVREGEQAMEDIEGLFAAASRQIVRTQTQTQTQSQTKQVRGGKKRVGAAAGGKKKRVVDSGIGMDGEANADEEEENEEMVAV